MSLLGNTPYQSKPEHATATKPKFSCLRKVLNQYKGKVLEGTGKLLPGNRLSQLSQNMEKHGSTEVLPDSLMRILQDLFHRLQLQEK